MKLIFRKSGHSLQSLIGENECPACSLSLLGQKLVIRNISIASRFLAVERIKIPYSFPDAETIVRENFPSIDVERFEDEDDDSSNTSFDKMIVNEQLNKDIEIPINSLMRYSNANSTLTIESIIYPWDFLNAVQKCLYEEVKQTEISPNASIAKTSIIEGPCKIEDNVTIDDYCKIKGPTYISKGSYIGMNSLVRSCMIGNQTKIGFNCEIARSYLGARNEIAHLNVILDSIIGENVWFGGYTGTANMLLNRKNIRYNIGDDNLIDTGTNRFGAVVGNNSAIGALVIILPGRKVPPNTIVQAGTIVGKKDLPPA